VPARSLTGGEIVLTGSAIETLAAGLRGEVLLAGSQDYERTRRVWPHGANFERLVDLKAKYDPTNLFRLNANVPPKIR
jgi:hypothetical protein